MSSSSSSYIKRPGLPQHTVGTKNAMLVTPGIDYIVKTSIPFIFGPSVLLHALLILVSNVWPVLSPTPLTLVCIYFLSLPLHITVSDRISRLNDVRAARRFGARIAPSVEGVLPGNLDLIYKGMSANKDQYIGEPWIHATRKHGTTFSIKILGTKRFCTTEPRNVQKVLVSDFGHYPKGEFVANVAGSVLGSGIFVTDGELWQFHRKMIRPFLSKERVTDLLLYERNATVALQKMQDRFERGLPVDFQDLVARFTLDSAAEFLLGASIHSLDSPLPLPHNSPVIEGKFVDTASTRFARAFDAVQVVLLNRLEMRNFWPLAEVFEDKTKNHMAEIRSFIDPIVRNAMKRRKQGESKDDQKLLDHLIDVTDDMKMIVDAVLNIMLAGRDTTASLLTFATYCLATHPTVLSRLREEIVSSLGSSRVPSYEELRGMRYLRAVLNETLRLFPPVPFSVREALDETTWVNEEGQKIYVPKGSAIAISFMHLHRSETYWGPDAHTFDPERWLDERVIRFTSNPFIFVPFNAGPRICVGQQFAYNEASFFLVQMLQHFDHLELAPESQPPKTRPPASWKDPTTAPLLGLRRPLEQCFPRESLTLYSDGGLWLRAKPVE